MNGIKFLRRIPFFSTLSPSHLRQVYRLAHEAKFAPGQPIFAKREDANAMFIVLSGRIKIFTGSAGKKRKTFAYVGAGEFFGEMALVEDLPRTASAQAIEASKLLWLRKKDFQRLLTRNPALTLYLLKTVCTRLRHANEELEEMLFHNILGRVAKTMLDQAKSFGEPWDGAGLALKGRFTHRELAELTGTTREPLARALSSLRRAGLVGLTSDGRYAIPEPQKLAKLCSND